MLDLPSILIVLACVVGIIAFWWLRKRHLMRLHALACQELAVPPVNVLSWSGPKLVTAESGTGLVQAIGPSGQIRGRVASEQDSGSPAKPTWAEGWQAASADAILSSLPAWKELAQFDWTVLDGIQLSAAADVDLSVYSDLKVYLKQHYFDVGEPEGFFTRLTGYVGEAAAGRTFEQAGHNVVFPEAPNHPGLDMWVDGDPVQVKVGGDAATFTTHFEKYPHIPVVTGPDNINVAPENLDVSFMEGLDADHIGNVTEQGLEAIGGDFGIGGPAIPLVTAMRSGFREFQLLTDGHTNVLTAAKNVGLDATGTAVGGWVGAKGGALLGSAFGPIGTVVGGVIGGIGGAIAGRTATNQIKLEPFREATGRYEASVSAVQSAMSAKEAECHSQVEAVVSAEQERLQKAVDRIANDLLRQVDAVRHECRHHAITFVSVFPKVLDRLRVSLQADGDERLRKLQRSRAMMAFFWPSLDDVKHDVIRSEVEIRMRTVSEARAQFQTLAYETPTRVAVEEAIRRIQAFFREHPFASRDFDHVCLQLQETISKTSAKETELTSSATELCERQRQQCARRVEAKLAMVAGDASVFAMQQATIVKDAKAQLIAEGKKVGIDLSPR